MPVKSSTAFRAAQVHFEITKMQLTPPDFTRQQQGRSCLGTKPELLPMKTGHYPEVTATMTSGDQFEDKLFAFSLSSYKQFVQSSY